MKQLVYLCTFYLFTFYSSTSNKSSAAFRRATCPPGASPQSPFSIEPATFQFQSPCRSRLHLPHISLSSLHLRPCLHRLLSRTRPASLRSPRRADRSPASRTRLSQLA